jgi:arsenite methyltransferase
MQTFGKEEIRAAVRERYGAIARTQGSDCGCSTGGASCCGASGTAADASRALGYSAADLSAVPEGANLGLGCGNPKAIASLKAGETVLDLGSGGGFDCFLAARAVGETGSVIGVDMTPDMITLARRNAEKGGYANTDFRLGEIEHLPVADTSVDVIISNCVVNLSPDKLQVYREAWRVLKHGGRLAISDVVASGEIPEALKKDLSSYSACVAGASPVAEVTRMLDEAGFTSIRVQPKDESRRFIKDWSSDYRVEDFALSATIEAVKP